MTPVIRESNARRSTGHASYGHGLAVVLLLTALSLGNIAMRASTRPSSDLREPGKRAVMTATTPTAGTPGPVTPQVVTPQVVTPLVPGFEPTVVTPTPTSSPTPTRPAGPAVLATDTFQASLAKPLFGATYMTFASVEGQGELTGKLSGAILPVMYDSPRVQDFIAEFELILPPVSTGSRYGLVFRSDDAASGWAHYYLVLIDPGAKQVRFLCFKDGEFPCLDTRQFEPTLLEPDKSISMRVEANGDEFRVLLNNVQVYETSDAHLPDAGYFGLAIVPGEKTPDAVRFDNLVIYSYTPPLGVPPVSLLPTLSPEATPTETRAAPAPVPTVRSTPLPPSPTRSPEPILACPNPASSLYWSDDFGNRQSGWTEFQGAAYNHFYKDGEFHFQVTARDQTGNAWLLLRDLGTRYRIQVRAWKLAGPNVNSYGLLFGGRDDSNYYAFRIADTGSYRIAKLVEGRWNDLTPWTRTSAIQPGGVNTLTLIADGAQIYACVNNLFLGMVTDPALQPGRVGMIAGAYDEPVHIHFDDFAVWKVEGAAAVPQPSSGASQPTAIPSNVLPGVYITALRTEPPNPKRNAGVSFVATFLNTTGAPQNFDWLVMVYQPDAKKAFGETDAQRITVPPGVTELGSASNWTVRGPGGCLPLYARPYYQNPDTSRTPFRQVDGNEETLGFSVCP